MGKGRLLIAVLVVAALAGCLPKARIEQFTVRPFLACPGEPITLSWRTNGNVTLRASPEAPGLGRRDPSGRDTVPMPGEATLFQLEVSRFFGLKKASTEGKVETPPLSREFIAVDSEEQTGFVCQDAERVVEASLVLDDDNFSPRVLTGQLKNRNARRIVVLKDGVSLPLEAAQASAFEQMPARGRWTLRVPYEEGEQCEDAIDAVDGRLVIELQLTCPR